MLEIKEQYGFIYITTNAINGKKYIGQRQFYKYWKSYLGSGINIRKAIKKYGKENFSREIVGIAYNQAELNLLEIEFIQKYNAIKSKEYYNVAFGGDGGNTFAGKTKEEITVIGKKISEPNKGNKHYAYGHHLTEETKIKLSEALSGIKHYFYGKHHSEESKIKMSKSRKGKYGGANHPLYGKHHTQESKLKMALNHEYMSGEKHQFYGKHHTTETKIKMSQTKRGKPNSASKKVVCITTGKVFNCIVNGAVFYNIYSGSSVYLCCKGERKSAGKHPETGEKLVWMFYDKYLKQNSVTNEAF